MFVEDENHTLSVGSDFFNSIGENSFVLDHKDDHVAGTVGVMFTNNEKLMFATQVGRNKSAGILGNSWMVIPNNLTDNMTIYSDCQWVADFLGAPLFVDCNTAGSGADFIVQDDIQSLFGAAFINGIRSRGFANFIMDGDDFDIFNGSLHARTPRQEEVGFDLGDTVTPLNRNFDNGLLDPFVQITSGGGSAEWNIVSDSQCHDGECAAAQGGVGSPVRTMEANFSTVDVEGLVLQFFLTTEGMSGADLLNITVNNNTGDEGVEVFSIVNGPAETDSYNVSALPLTMEDIPSVSIRLSFSASNPINTFAWVDDIIINGTASANTLANVTRLDTQILLGDGSQSMFWNDSSKTLQLPGNTTFISESVVDLNVTGSITLNDVTINDFGEINANSSNFWDNLNSPNATQMENSGGVLNILESWHTTFFDGLFSGKTTDNLAEGSTNKYDNQSWNQSHADNLYADISQVDTNFFSIVNDWLTNGTTSGINTTNIELSEDVIVRGKIRSGATNQSGGSWTQPTGGYTFTGVASTNNLFRIINHNGDVVMRIDGTNVVSSFANVLRLTNMAGDTTIGDLERDGDDNFEIMAIKNLSLQALGGYIKSNNQHIFEDNVTIEDSLCLNSIYTSRFFWNGTAVIGFG